MTFSLFLNKLPPATVFLKNAVLLKNTRRLKHLITLLLLHLEKLT